MKIYQLINKMLEEDIPVELLVLSSVGLRIMEKYNINDPNLIMYMIDSYDEIMDKFMQEVDDDDV